jgi:redox-sensitive bicupin YhaK (pirin superfamily)
MSDLMPSADVLDCQPGLASAPILESYPARQAALPGGLVVRRALPRAGRRLVGPWCFLDHYGPLAFGVDKPMSIGPHPHIGLQTVTWLIEGEALHRDSLGNERLITPGQLNLMTAGFGISHSEETPQRNSGRLHGVQLWVALPETRRHMPPSFDHYAELPTVELGGGRAVVLMGELNGVRSPANAHSRMVGADIVASNDADLSLPLDSSFEHALILIDGDVALGDRKLELSTLYYLGTGRDAVTLTARTGSRLMLLGGAPFGESILMWWNFVGRTPEEIAKARNDWEQGSRFGSVAGYLGDRIPAPPLSLRPQRPGS